MKFAFIHVEKASSPVDWLCSAWMSRAAATTHGLIAVLRAGLLKTRGLGRPLPAPTRAAEAPMGVPEFMRICRRRVSEQDGSAWRG